MVFYRLLAAHSEATNPADALKQEIEKREAEIRRLQKELDHARMKSASSSVAAVSENDAPPVISPRTIAPRMGVPVSSRTTPAMRLVCAMTGALQNTTKAAAKTANGNLEFIEEV